MADLAAEMKAALAESEPGPANALEAAEEVLETSTAPGAAEGTGDTPGEDPEAPGEAEEASPEDTAAAAEAKKKAEEDRSKDSSYKRLQKRAEIAKEDARSARKDAAEALAIANDWRRKAIVVANELKKVIGEASRGQYRRDPRDDRLLASELRSAEQDVRRGMDEHIQQTTASAEVQDLSRQYTEEATDLASKYLPGDPKATGKILRAFAAVVESSPNEEVSMEEVADLLRARTAKAQGPKRQLEKNRSVVRPIRGPGPSRGLELGTSTGDMKKFLKSQGLA